MMSGRVYYPQTCRIRQICCRPKVDWSFNFQTTNREYRVAWPWNNQSVFAFQACDKVVTWSQSLSSRYGCRMLVVFLVMWGSTRDRRWQNWASSIRIKFLYFFGSSSFRVLSRAWCAPRSFLSNSHSWVQSSLFGFGLDWYRLRTM